MTPYISKATGLLFLCLGILPILHARTFYISPTGNDANRGSLEKPLRTISSGARRAKPGDTILVLEGTYRERITPVQGGEKGQPITYRGETGKRVFIKGSELWMPRWAKEEDGIFSARPDPSLFNDRSPEYIDHHNPFEVRLSSTPYGRDGLPEHIRKEAGDRKFKSADKQISYTCGQLFIDGSLWKQVPLRAELKPNTWWYNSKEQRLHVYFGKLNPENLNIEITTRRRLFAPVKRGLGHIIVEGFIFEHCGNQYPTDFWKIDQHAQRGAIGLAAGHHWKIRKNIIRFANTVGIDCGRMDRHSPTLSTSHHNQIEGNYLMDNGSAGILSYGSRNLIIRNNVILRNNSLQFSGPKRWEHAGIKCHQMEKGLILRNYIAHNPHSPGLWLDNEFPDTKIRQNIIHHNGTHGLFLEMSDYGYDRLLVDQNIIFANGKKAVYIHDASGATFSNNILACNPENKIPERAIQIKQVSSRTRSQKHSFFNNLIIGDGPLIEVNYPSHRSGPQRFDYNLYTTSSSERNFVINAYSDQPTPWTSQQFRELMLQNINQKEKPSSYIIDEKQIGLTANEWRLFWQKMKIPNDQNSEFASGIQVRYDPEKHLLFLSSPTLYKQGNPSRNRAENALIFKFLKENRQTPPAGPFQSSSKFIGGYKVWDGLPLCPAGQLPPNGWANPKVTNR
jgi:hypothetical protein